MMQNPRELGVRRAFAPCELDDDDASSGQTIELPNGLLAVFASMLFRRGGYIAVITAEIARVGDLEADMKRGVGIKRAGNSHRRFAVLRRGAEFQDVGD